MPGDLQQALASGIVLGLIYGLVAVGFAVVFGAMRIKNFAHGEFVMGGMYLTILAYQILGLPLPLAMAAAVAMSSVLGAATHRTIIQPILDRHPMFQMMTTLGVLIIAQQVVSVFFGDQARGIETALNNNSLNIGAAVLTWSRLSSAAIAIVAIFAVYAWLGSSYTGRAVRAAADNSRAVMLLGVSPTMVNTIAFAVGAACAGLAGSLLVTFTFVQPYIGIQFTLRSFIIVLIAGVTSPRRAVTVGVVLGLVESVSGIYVALSFVPLVVFALLISALVAIELRRRGGVGMGDLAA